MKNGTTVTLKMMVTLLIFNFIQLALWAQDSTSSTSTTSTSSETKININGDEAVNWYTNPLVWIIGAAVFILLLVALLRGGGRDRTDTVRSDKTTVTKTVHRDTDIDPDAV